MLKDLYRLYRQNKLLREEFQSLSKEDKVNIAGLYVDPKYKALEKLMDNVVVALDNKTFSEAQRLEEFLAAKWVRASMRLLKGQIKEQYNISIKPKNDEGTKGSANLEDLPDGTYGVQG